MKKLLSFFTPKFFADGVCFVLAKGTSFLVPLLAVRAMALSDYGFLETSFAWGQQLTTLFSLGLPAAYPFFILKRRETYMPFYFWAYGCLLFLLAALAAGLYLSDMIARQPYFILLLTALFSAEKILSAVLKTHGFGRIGVLVDSLYYFGLGFALLVFWLMPSKSFFTILFIILILVLLLLAIWNGILLISRWKHFKKRISWAAVKRLLSISIPLIFSGVIIYWLVACSRIYLSWLLGDEVVGIYSFCFRFFAIAILIYQFCYIMFFKKLYIVSPEKLDRNFSLLLGTVFICSFFCLVLFLLLRPFFSSIRYGKLVLVLLELGCFMPVWCATALNEGILARENQILKMNLLLLPQIILFPLLIFCLRAKMTLEVFCALHLCSCALVFFTQSVLLYRNHVRLVKSSIIIGIITVFGLASFFLLN